MLRRFLVAALVGLAVTPTALAHVTINPNEVPADSFSRFALRVPNERDDADTVKVTVQLPQGLEDVSFQPKPGWTRTVTTEGERIATVTWEGGKIGPGEFDEFGLSAHVPDTPGQALSFPALQEYEGGEVVRWIGAPDSDEPGPRVELTAAAAATSNRSDSGGGRDGLTLGLSIAGLVAGLAALGAVLVRSPRRA